jgi:ATP-binding cassette subfamily B protein
LFLDDFERFRRLRPAEHQTSDAPTTAPVRGRIVVDHVSFRYPGTDTLVLDDVSLELAPGEIVALVGLSGSGKTTLAHLVAGLYRPTKGRIFVGGVDTATIPRSEYWPAVAVVFQDFVRYQLTARENLAMSDRTRLDDLQAVIEAADRAGIERVLERLPAGYETMMSRSYEGGADLSIGEWQRVAVARAFFRDTPLLILDEPAAALDAVAEQRLYDRLEELCRDRSVLLISHRFSTVRMAHRICVLEGGRIVEQGSHAELMALGGQYAELFTLQAKGYLPEAFSAEPSGEASV